MTAFLGLIALGMVSTVAADTYNDNTASSDWDGTSTTSNSSLAGDSSQDSGDEFENDSTEVKVRVTSTVAVDIKPEVLDYPYVDVGEQETKSNRSFESVTIRNTGSEDIDRIWLNASYPSDNPLGEAASQYDAGNFFQVKINPDTESTYGVETPNVTSTYHYVNRVDYAFESDSEVPSYITASPLSEMQRDGSDNADEVELGAFRVGGEEYYYALLESSAGCTGGGSTAAELRVANTSNTADRLGTVDFTDDGPSNEPRDWTRYTVEQNTDSEYGIVNGEGGEGVTLGSRTYDVLTACDDAAFVDDSTEHTLRTRYNVNPGSVDDLAAGNGGVTDFVFSASGGDSLSPNSFITLDTAVEVPRGVSQGQVDPGTFRVFITSDNA